ncbi:MAG: glycerol-3-phosphate acyltransferase [Symbiopectobacterium sp.]
MTNVLRIGGKTAATVLVFDVLKGMLPNLECLCAWHHTALSWYYCNYHLFGPYLSGIFYFRGEERLTTAVLCHCAYQLGFDRYYDRHLAACLAAFSLEAIVSALIAPYLCVVVHKPQFTFPVAMLSCLILMRHHDNIQRLCGVGRKVRFGSAARGKRGSKKEETAQNDDTD